MANVLVGTVSAKAPTQIDVDTASKTIVAENLSRVGIVLTNISDGTVYLSFGTHPAVVGSGTPLLASGGNWTMDEYSYTKEAIQAIAHSNNSALAIQEFENLA